MAAKDTDGAACCGCLMVVASALLVVLMALACVWLYLHL